MKLPTIPKRIPTDDRGYGRQQRERGRNRDRRAEQPWRAWYDLDIWRNPITGLRAQQLARQPMCEVCRRVRATIAHHRHPHNGEWEMFIDPENLQSVCKGCHDGAIQRGERAGNYAPRAELAYGIAIPTNVLYPRSIRPCAVPLTIVTGPPACGKSAYVDQHKRSGDVVIDLDEIIAEIAGSPVRSAEAKRRYLHAALIERNRLLGTLADERAAGAAWFIVGGAPGWERERWAMALGAERIVVIETPPAICIARIHRDVTRASIALELEEAVRDWFARYTSSNIAREIHVEGIGGFV